jgi:hypothetical protein
MTPVKMQWRIENQIEVGVSLIEFQKWVFNEHNWAEVRSTASGPKQTATNRSFLSDRGIAREPTSHSGLQ